MVTIGMNYDVREGKGQQFESVFKSVLELMEGMAGHKKSALYTNVYQPNSYLIVSEWTDEDAFRTFTTSEKFGKIVDWGKEQILASRPRHEVYGQEERGNAPARCPIDHGSPV